MNKYVLLNITAFLECGNLEFYNFIYFQLIPVISSLTPITTLLPLVGVLTITALKDAYDDIVRIEMLFDTPILCF